MSTLLPWLQIESKRTIASPEWALSSVCQLGQISGLPDFFPRLRCLGLREPWQVSMEITQPDTRIMIRLESTGGTLYQTIVMSMCLRRLCSFADPSNARPFDKDCLHLLPDNIRGTM